MKKECTHFCYAPAFPFLAVSLGQVNDLKLEQNTQRYCSRSCHNSIHACRSPSSGEVNSWNTSTVPQIVFLPCLRLTHLKILVFRVLCAISTMDDSEEYLLRWNSHNSEVITEFHELCRVSQKSTCDYIVETSI